MMDKLWQYTNDSDWWFSVVIVSLVMNVFAAYLKGWLDKGFSLVSGKYRMGMIRQKQEQLDRVLRLVNHPQLLEQARQQEIRHRLLIIQLTLYGLTLVAVGIADMVLQEFSPASRYAGRITAAAGVVLMSIAHLRWGDVTTLTKDIKLAYERISESLKEL